jgi:hypothetical protein
MPPWSERSTALRLFVRRSEMSGNGALNKALANGEFEFHSRGDKTPLELFLAGVRGWEAGLRQWLW